MLIAVRVCACHRHPPGTKSDRRQYRLCSYLVSQLNSQFGTGWHADRTDGTAPVFLLPVFLPAIAILLPGYTISLGAGELVGQRVVSGTANLMNGLVCLIKQIAGGWLGVVLVTSLIPGIQSAPSTPVSQTWIYVVPIASCRPLPVLSR